MMCPTTEEGTARVRQSHPLLEEVDAPALAQAMAGDDPPLLVDVRTEPERAVAAIQPSLHIGLDRFVDRAPAEIPTDRDVVVYCHVGARSAQAAVWMKASGWSRVRSLAGGIDAWSEQVDPEVPRYR
jgi:sulfur-carrier protein adenylyltransferase/sulfurtransferase